MIADVRLRALRNAASEPVVARRWEELMAAVMTARRAPESGRGAMSAC
jgi:hypothetical protein